MLGHVLRGVGFTLAAVLLFTLAGRGDAEDLGVLFVGLVTYYLLWPPLMALVDRNEGGLELLASLPVAPSTLAGARLTANALALAPVPVHAVLAAVLLVGPALGLEPSLPLLSAVAILSWALSVGITGLGAGVMIRWGPEAVGRGPGLVFALAIMLVVLFGERYEAAIASAVSELVTRTGVAWTVGVLATLASVLSIGLSYRLISTGLERFQPDRERSGGRWLRRS
jgi:hypothetical protein